MWAAINKLMGRSKTEHGNIVLEENNVKFDRPAEVSNIINDYFLTSIESLRRSIPSNDSVTPPLVNSRIINDPVSQSFYVLPFNAGEISNIISGFKCKGIAISSIPVFIIRS